MANLSDYEWHIETEKLNPPLGSNHYAAKLAFVIKRIEGGPDERINPGLGEMWGPTAEEARNKVERAVKEWIAGQP